MHALRSTPKPAMDSHAESAKYLQSLIGRTLRIHISDTRIFVGEFKCTDNVRAVFCPLPIPSGVRTKGEYPF